MTELKNRQVWLRTRPTGIPRAGDFGLREAAMPAIEAGAFLVHNHFLSADPAQRGWITDSSNYVQQVAIGDTMRAAAAGVVIESRNANNQIDQLRTLAAELIARQVDVIVATGGNNPGLVAKSMTSTIPILFTSGVDPVRVGLVTSLSRPEANVTGVSWFGADMAQKSTSTQSSLSKPFKRTARPSSPIG